VLVAGGLLYVGLGWLVLGVCASSGQPVPEQPSHGAGITVLIRVLDIDGDDSITVEIDCATSVERVTGKNLVVSAAELKVLQRELECLEPSD
jgi:hypothetical protein